MSSSTPATTVACRRRARPASTSAPGLLRKSPVVWRMPSGHTTRSSGGCSRAAASAWRANTMSGSVVTARVPRGPPPWTRAMRRDRPVGWPPALARPPSTLAASTHPATATAAGPGQAARLREAPACRRPMTQASWAARAAPARTTPATTVAPVMSRLPPRRARGMNGPWVWPNADEPRGKPPIGKRSRAHSARSRAAGRPRATSRNRRAGTTRAAIATNRAETTTSTP